MRYLIFLITFALIGCGSEENKLNVTVSDEVCTFNNARDNGYDISNVLSVKGIRRFSDVSSCEIEQCNNNYELKSGAKSCTPIPCTMENSTVENSTSVSGDLVNGCFATGCSWGTYLDDGHCLPLNCDPNLQHINMNSCIDNDITNASVKFVETISKNLINTISFENTTNIKTVGMYSDENCVVSIGSVVNVNDFNKNITLPDSDGIKDVYIKYFNETKSSQCLKASIEIDKTSPLIGITYPLNNAKIGSGSINVSGTCSDKNLIPTIKVSVGNSSSTVSCVSNEFTASLMVEKPQGSNISSLIIAVQSTDTAGNVTNVNQNIESINCSAFEDLIGDSCVDKNIVNPEISFVKTRTNVLNNEIKFGNTENAQEYAYFNNGICSGAQLFRPIDNKIVTLNNEEGVRDISVIFKNNSKKSECVSTSIVFDSIAPLATIEPIVTYQDDIVTDSSIDLQLSHSEELSSLVVRLNSTEIVNIVPTTLVNTINVPLSSIPSTGNNEFVITIVSTDLAGNIITQTTDPYKKRNLIRINVNNLNTTYGYLIMEKKVGENVLSTENCVDNSCSIYLLNSQNFSLGYVLKENGKFKSFSSNCTIIENTCLVNNIQEDVNITSNFEPLQYIVAVDDEASVVQDGNVSIPFSDLLSNDIALVSNHDKLSIINIQNTVGGVASINTSTKTITFSPSVKTGEAASFVYTVSDTENAGKTATAKVSVTVTHLPEREALIYSGSDSTSLNQILTARPPTMRDMFDTWGLYESTTGATTKMGGLSKNHLQGGTVNFSHMTQPIEYSGNTVVGPVVTRVAHNKYWENRDEMMDYRLSYLPGADLNQPYWFSDTEFRMIESVEWMYNADLDRIIQPLNTISLTGLVSPLPYEDYDLEFTVSSTSPDDDYNGGLLALTTVNDVNHHIAVGVAPQSGRVTLSYNNYHAGGITLATFKDPTMTILEPHSNAAADNKPAEEGQAPVKKNGWMDVENISFKVKRRGDIFEISFTDWRGATFLDQHKMILNLNSHPELEKFKGPNRYGFLNQSQPLTTFSNIKFEASGELKESELFDLATMQTYNYVVDSWQNTPITNSAIANKLGFPRCILNPKTGKRFYINSTGTIITSVPTCPNN